MKPWQKFILEHFKGNEFYNVPEKFRGATGLGYTTFSEFREKIIEGRTFGYAREAATLSMLFRPKVIVELGSHAGNTSLLLCRLNPDAHVHMVDITSKCPQGYPVGYFVMMNQIKNYTLHIMNSWEFKLPGQVDFTYIDAEHTEESAWKDSWQAWENKNEDEDWCIVWDDYHPGYKGVIKAVDRFCAEVGYKLQRILRWHWIGTKEVSEEELIEYRVTEKS